MFLIANFTCNSLNRPTAKAVRQKELGRRSDKKATEKATKCEKEAKALRDRAEKASGL